MKSLSLLLFLTGTAFVQTAGRLGESGLRRALDLLVEVDHQSKSGVGDAAENVERFLLTVGNEMRPVPR